MIERITEWLMNWCERKGRVLRITGTAGPDDVYLIRYYILKSKYLNIFIHQFLRSDRDDLHDHPWDFVTYLVRGSYDEQKWNPKLGEAEWTRRANTTLEPEWVERIQHIIDHKPEIFGNQIVKNTYKMNRFVFRRATDQHKVVVNRDLKPSEKDKAALTICVTGPTRREWGFIKERAPRGIHEHEVVEWNGKVREWTPWRKYLGLPDDTPGRG